jgi:hypothetical protein
MVVKPWSNALQRKTQQQKPRRQDGTEIRKFGSVVNETSAWRGGYNVIIKLKLEELHRRTRTLLAISISGLLLAPMAMAEQVAPGSPTAPQTALNPYATPGAVPPPPGPYGLPPGAPDPRFRPDPDLEAAPRGMPPGMPADFSRRSGQGPLTRQQFNERQEAHRKQLDQYYQQREAEMNKRVEEMQKRMDAMQAQSEAERNRQREGMPPPAPESMQVPEEVQQRWEQQKAEQDRRWEQQKAEQEQRMQQIRAEREKRFEQMKAQRDQRLQGQAQYRPQTEAPAQAPQQPVQAPAPQPAAPAYGYPPRGYGYGYGYPPPRYGYGGPGWGYPRPPAPVAGGQQPAR